MINTNELMLGDLVEYKGSYGVITKICPDQVDIKFTKGTNSFEYNGIPNSNINPIELTDDVLNRMNGNISHFENFRYLHIWQNARTINNPESGALDITPLLSPRYTTHDGVDVWEGDLVYYTIINSYINPQQTIVSKSNMDKIGYMFFSTLDACKSYIDKVTRKPIFTTEDGVDVFEGDEYWIFKYPYNIENKPDIIRREATIDVWKNNDFLYFSTEQLAQAYLNKVWAEKEYNDLINKK